MKPEKLY